MAKSAMFSLWLNVILYLGILGLHVVKAGPLVPAIYVFGDSTADVGTNNYLRESRARADSPFYGIDFPVEGKIGKPTGRFSNGYNTIDVIAMLLGFYESPPPFLSFTESNISEFLIRTVPTKGINFASGGSGLLNQTGQHKWGKVISFGEQVQQFASVRSNISELLSASAVVANISKSLFLISVGSNDIFEHFDPYFTASTNRSYITTLISSYEAHLRNLYELGARKFAIISVGAVGCCPIHRTYSGGCSEAMNVDAQLFYTALRGLLRKLGSECKGFMYALGNAYELSKFEIDHPRESDFRELRRACCGKGKWNAQKPCRPDSVVCGNRNTYMFWDQYHPTQAAAELTATALTYGLAKAVEPMGFIDLALRPNK